MLNCPILLCSNIEIINSLQHRNHQQHIINILSVKLGSGLHLCWRIPFVVPDVLTFCCRGRVRDILRNSAEPNVQGLRLKQLKLCLRDANKSKESLAASVVQ